MNLAKYGALSISIILAAASLLVMTSNKSDNAVPAEAKIIEESPVIIPLGRNPEGTITFSGLTWIVRDNGGAKGGPGPNVFSSSPENVLLDKAGQLHLRITYRDGIWNCAEVYTKESLGYGKYIFMVGSRIGDLDVNVVVGLFTYLDDFHEIDIEFARWGYSTGKNAHYSVQPWYISGNSRSFDMVLNSQYSTHSIDWQSDRIQFQSLHGFIDSPSGQESIIHEWTYTGADIPTPSTERAHINLWLMSGIPPSDGQEVEVVVTRFEFQKSSVQSTGESTGGDALLDFRTQRCCWTDSNIWTEASYSSANSNKEGKKINSHKPWPRLGPQTRSQRNAASK